MGAQEICGRDLKRALGRSALEGSVEVGRFRRAAHRMPELHSPRCGDGSAHGLELILRGICRDPGDDRNALPGNAADMMAEQMIEQIAAAEIIVNRSDIEMKFAGAGRLFVQAGERRLADQSAGDIEIIAVFVGAGTDDGIIEGYGIGFSHHDMLAQFWPAGKLVGRTGPNRLCPELRGRFPSGAWRP